MKPSVVPKQPMFRSERFDLRKLYYFIRIVEVGSISRASVELCVAQPALSKSIQNLEFDLNTSLLERSVKGVQPTRSGRKLYEHCKVVFQQLETARAEIQGRFGAPRGAVTIGIPYSINLVLAAPLLRAALERFPELDLQIVEAPSIALADQLIANRIDLGVMISEGYSRAGIQSREILQEDFVLVRRFERMEGDHHHVDLPVRFDELVDRPIILAKGQLRSMVEERFARFSLKLTAVREIDTFSMIPQCVEAGIGDAILPAGWAGAVNGKRTASTPFEGGTMNRRVAVCHAATRPVSLPSACILQLVEEISARLVKSNGWFGAQLIQEQARPH